MASICQPPMARLPSLRSSGARSACSSWKSEKLKAWVTSNDDGPRSSRVARGFCAKIAPSTPLTSSIDLAHEYAVSKPSPEAVRLFDTEACSAW